MSNRARRMLQHQLRNQDAGALASREAPDRAIQILA